MNTRTHVLSSTTLVAGVSGDVLYDTGPTTLVLSFSGVNDSGNYLKFLVEYSNDPDMYIVQNTTKVTDVKNETIKKTFLPTTGYSTTYSVDVSGLKNDLSVDRYRVTLKLGKGVTNAYKDIKVVNSQVYTNSEGSNYLLLSLEAQNPRHLGNVVIPFIKDTSVYLPGPGPVFRPSDNHILRTEIFSHNGSYVPVITDPHEIVREDQIRYMTIMSEGDSDGYFKGGHGLAFERDGTYNVVPSPVLDVNGDSVESRLDMMLVPEDGIDYSVFEQNDHGLDEENFGELGVVNVYIEKIYLDGVAP